MYLFLFDEIKEIYTTYVINIEVEETFNIQVEKSSVKLPCKSQGL